MAVLGVCERITDVQRSTEMVHASRLPPALSRPWASQPAQQCSSPRDAYRSFHIHVTRDKQWSPATLLELQ